MNNLSEFTNSKGIPPATQLRCKVGESESDCKKRLANMGWTIPSNAVFKEDKDGSILALPFEA